MFVARNIQLVRDFYAAGLAFDDADRLSFFAPGAVWHVPGENPVSGPYSGPDAITRDIAARMAPLDRWELDVVNVMGNANMVVATIRVRGTRHGVSIDTDGAHAFRFDANGHVVEA